MGVERMIGSVRSGRLRGAWIGWIGALALCAGLPGSVRAEEGTTTLTLDPAASEISFEVGSTLHTVEGTARLVSGVLHFDPAGGPAGGTIEVDATSLETGNGMRDDKLHGSVLESQRYPRIVFHASRLVVPGPGESGTDVRMEGTLDLHGGSWPLTIPATVHRTGETVEIEAHFPVPFVEWGLEDPSIFLLSVDKVVQVHVRARGRIDPVAR